MKTLAMRVNLSVADTKVADLDFVTTLMLFRKTNISIEASDVKNSRVVDTMMWTKMSRPILMSEECLKWFSWMLMTTTAKKPIRTMLPKIVSSQ